ncbi:MAG: efflux RND transporter permease subunit [Chlamydiota bacterium]
MNLSEPFIKKPVMTTLLTACVLVFGIFSYRSLPVSDLPDVEFPTIAVTVSYPGSNPETIAATCAVPLEREFLTIDGLQTLFSNNMTGTSTLVLQFSLTKSMDTAALDVQAAIDRALPKLPPDLPYNPTYKKINPAQTPILYIAITSEGMDQQELYDYGNTYIGQRLSTIEGISQVITFGSPYAARIQIDPGEIACRGITMDDVASAIEEGNVELATGVLYGQKQETTIDISGQIEKADDYNFLVIKSENGSFTKIADVGRAIRSFQDDKLHQRYLEKGRSLPCVVLAIQTLPGANAAAVSDAVFRRLPSLEKELPASLRYHTVYSKKAVIIEAVQDVEITLLIALILVILIIYLSFGKILNTLIPALAIPMSILATFCALYAGGFSIDILSLLALTLSIGFLVDDAIVVLENSIRHVHKGKSPEKATLLGAKEISVTVLSMTLCLISVFLPLFFLGSVLGRLFQEFAFTIVSAVFFSGVISLTLTPLLCSRCIPSKSSLKKKTFIEKRSLALQEFLTEKYKKSLVWVLEEKRIILALGALSLIGSFWLFRNVKTDFLPTQDEGFIQAFTQSEDGTSPFLQKALQEQVVDLCIRDPAVHSIVSVTSIQDMLNDNQGLFFIQLKPLQERRSVFSVMEDLTKKVREIPGINSYLSPLPLINLTLGTTTKALYQYSLVGLDTATLQSSIEMFLAKMHQRSDLFTEVSSDLQIRQPQVSLKIDRDRASHLGISAQDIETLFSHAYSDNKISTINTNINQYDVILETLPAFYRNEEAFSYLFLRGANNHLVPLKEVVSWEHTAGPLSLTRINSLPAATLSFNVANGKTLGEALEALGKFAKDLPKSVTGKPQGSTAAFAGMAGTLLLLFLSTIFVIYVILGILYESFFHPLTVMSALPPATFGGLFSLYITGMSLSIFSFVGLMMLIGIVMKNGIMVVDFAVVNIAKGEPRTKAICNACTVRFRPIIMTTLAAFMGALPIALGLGGPSAKTRASLGVVVVGGLLFSQLLTLFVTPVIFDCLERLREGWIGKAPPLKDGDGR